MKTNNKKMNVKTLAFSMMLTLGLGACSDGVETLPVPGPAPLVTTRLAAFAGTGQPLDRAHSYPALRSGLVESAVRGVGVRQKITAFTQQRGSGGVVRAHFKHIFGQGEILRLLMI